ncbi:hypothetical protein R6Q57_014371 [Mikania cordata]
MTDIMEHPLSKPIGATLPLLLTRVFFAPTTSISSSQVSSSLSPPVFFITPSPYPFPVIMPPSALDRLVFRAYSNNTDLHSDFLHIDDEKFAFTRRRYCASKECDPSKGLETTLRNFSCLTTGDSIMVAYNKKKYYINIIESKPSNAISIIETDCEVDFAPPLDYKEPERPASSVPKNNALMQDESAPAEEPKFNPFTGSGRRLDGKPLKYQPPPVTTSSGSNGKQPAVSGGGIGRPSSSSRQSQGKLVFGSKASSSADPKNHKEVVKDVKQEQPAKEEPKFQAFTGKKYSLKG